MYRRILVPLDGSQKAECVLPHIAKFDRPKNAAEKPKVFLLRVFEPRLRRLLLDPAQALRSEDASVDTEEFERARDYLLGIRDSLQTAGVAAEVSLIQGAPVRGIRQAIEELDIDLVMFASRGQVSLREAIFGSVGSSLLGRTHQAANLVVHPGGAKPRTDIRHIVMPLDGSPSAEHIASHVEFLAREHDATVTLVRVINLRYRDEVSVLDELLEDDAPKGEETIFSKLERDHTVSFVRDARKYLARWHERLSSAGIAVRETLLHGPIAAAISHAAKNVDADLVAMASHGRSPLSQMFYGGVAAEVLRQLERPILIVHPPTDA